MPASPSMTTAAPRRWRWTRPMTRSIAAISRSRPTIGPGDVGRYTIHAPMPASPRNPWSSTAVDCPRRTTDPRCSVARRSRAARRVASSSRISPGRAIDWIRAAVVIASPVRRRSPSAAGPSLAATTSPVARPIRTSIASPPLAELLEPRADVERGERGAHRVVVVRPRPAEHREHGVADELLARAAEPLDRGRHRREGGRSPAPGPPRGRARRASGRSRRGRRRAR